MGNRGIISDWQFCLLDTIQKENILSLVRKDNIITSLPLNLSEFIVPGTLQSNIARESQLDPYYERNMENFQEYEESILFLISEVDIECSDERNILLFDYIDTVCDIYLNGNLIKQTKNAHMIIEVDLPLRYLKKGTNQLILFIYPPLPVTINTDPGKQFRERVLFRKATYNYGWDFAPRSLTKGIGKVLLTTKKLIDISDIYTHTLEIQNDECVQFVEWGIDSEVEEEKVISLQIY
ncbi:MAG: glycosyl hydrolase 2 galactose-binding domain-containing protein, partial [Candidatus Hodarchaeales archaeon]